MTRDPRARALVWTVIVIGTLVRLVLAGVTGLGVDESYAVAVAHPFSLSYFDHPPLVFWIAGLTSDLVGANALLLRLPFILLFGGTTWLVFRLGARLFDERAGAYGAAILNLAPFFTLSAGSWIVPDGPLMFCLAAGAYCLSRAIFEPGENLGWWTAAGVWGGGAGLSKYVAVFAALGLVAFLATSGERRWLTRAGPWVALGVGLLVVSPVLIWNASHDWASFRFQGGHTGVSTFSGVHPGALVTNLGGQALYYLPWIWLGLLVALVAGFRAGSGSRQAFLAWLAVGPILVLAILALGGHPGLPHWAAAGYLFLFPLAGVWAARSDTRLVPWGMVGTAAFLVLPLGVLGLQASTGAVSDVVPRVFRQGDPTLELLDWDEVRPVVAQFGSARMFVGAPDWMAAGKLAYALGPSVPLLCLGGAPHQFAYRTDQGPFRGRDALLVARPEDQGARDLFTRRFEEVDSLGTLTIHRGGRPAFDLVLSIGHVFLPDPSVPGARRSP